MQRLALVVGGLIVVAFVGLVSGCIDSGPASGGPDTESETSDATPETSVDTQGDSTASCVDGLSRPCGRSKGICSKGSEKCVDGEWNECSGETYTEPEKEKCDGRDNNCDGRVDESCTCTEGETQECGPSTGACEPGSQTCRDGTWSPCEGGTGKSAEQCNGADDDCDGRTDEGLSKKKCAEQRGVCAGAQVGCRNGDYSQCGASEYGPNYEANESSCDGRDNDCDGKTDEGGACSIWRLKSGSNRWERFPLDPKNTSHAPSRPILAAFDIESQDKIVVLTDQNYRLFRPSTLRWEQPKPVSNLVPGIGGANIMHVFSVPASHPSGPANGEDGLTLLAIDNGTPKAWVGTFQPTSNSAVWSSTGKILSPRTEPAAPPSYSKEDAQWVGLSDPRGWVTKTSYSVCRMGSRTQTIQVYGGTLGGNKFYLYDAGTCTQFVQNYSYSQSPLASYGRAPPSFLMIGAATLHNGDLYLFKGD